MASVGDILNDDDFFGAVLMLLIHQMKTLSNVKNGKN